MCCWQQEILDLCRISFNFFFTCHCLTVNVIITSVDKTLLLLPKHYLLALIECKLFLAPMIRCCRKNNKLQLGMWTVVWCWLGMFCVPPLGPLLLQYMWFCCHVVLWHFALFKLTTVLLIYIGSKYVNNQHCHRVKHILISLTSSMDMPNLTVKLYNKSPLNESQDLSI
jgi:hypothetical protein